MYFKCIYQCTTQNLIQEENLLPVKTFFKTKQKLTSNKTILNENPQIVGNEKKYIYES